MKVAAFQAHVPVEGSMDALESIRMQVDRCEREEIAILCCPEAVLGGLADYSENPLRFAIGAEKLDSVLAPLASNAVTSIVGFTELGAGDVLYNSAAVFCRGTTVGVYRKLHPAINRSVYEPGDRTPVFRVGDLTFGIVLCNDSNYVEPAGRMAAQGATALFIPTNNGLPLGKPSAKIAGEARTCDIARARENGMWVIRADVTGRTGDLLSLGSSGIFDPQGTVVQAAHELTEELIVAEIWTGSGNAKLSGTNVSPCASRVSAGRKLL